MNNIYIYGSLFKYYAGFRKKSDIGTDEELLLFFETESEEEVKKVKKPAPSGLRP